MSVEAGKAFVGLEFKKGDLGALEAQSAAAGEKSSGSFLGSWKKAFIGIGGLFAGIELVHFGVDAVKEAAVTQKAIENVRAQFKGASTDVLSFSDTAAQSFGISKQASLDFSSSVGLAATNIGLNTKQAAGMAIGYQKLAGSIGLIKGIDPAGVFDKLKLAMLGNTRGLKSLGISFSTAQQAHEALILGIKGSSADWSAADKAQIIYGLSTQHLGEFLKQAKAHSGDLIDTQRRLTAEWTNAKEEVGSALLPILEKLAGVLARNLPTAFAAIGTGARAFGAAINAIATSAPAIAVFTHVLEPLGHLIAGVAGGVASLVREFQAMRAGGASLGDTLKFIATDALERLGVSFSTAQSIIGGFSKALSTIRDVAERIGGAIARAAAPLVSFVSNTDNLKKVVQSSIAFVQRYEELFGTLGAALGIVVGALVAYTAATEAYTAATRIAFAAQIALDGAMDALPIIALGIAIVALVAAVIYLYRHNETARQVIQTAWHAIESIITGTLHVVTAVIHGFVSVALGFWHTFGGAITKIARTDFEVISGVIRGALKIVEGVIKVALGLIHGNWSQVWNGLKEIVRGVLQIVVSIIRGAVSLAAAAARALGLAVVHGIENAITGLAGFVRQKVGSIPGAVRSVISSVTSAAKAIGEAIINGIKNGITGLASNLASTVKNTVTGALGGLGSALGIGSPSKWTRDHLGIPIIQGIITGFDSAGPGIKTTLDKHIGRALQVPLPQAGPARLQGITAAGGFDGVGAAQFSFDGTVLLDGKEVGHLVDVRIKRADQRRGRNLSAGRTWQPA
jgi:phage-related protein